MIEFICKVENRAMQRDFEKAIMDIAHKHKLGREEIHDEESKVTIKYTCSERR